MKLLKQEDIKDWNYKHFCTICNSELLVEQEDLIYKRCSDFDGDYDSFESSCLVCNTKFYIQQNKIPNLMKVLLKAAKNGNHSR